MSRSQLYSKLALQRCQMYLGQLCAANYLMEDDNQEMVTTIIKDLNQDLEILERYIDTAE